jgi:hypothetical protein
MKGNMILNKDGRTTSYIHGIYDYFIGFPMNKMKYQDDNSKYVHFQIKPRMSGEDFSLNPLQNCCRLTDSFQSFSTVFICDGDHETNPEGSYRER